MSLVQINCSFNASLPTLMDCCLGAVKVGMLGLKTLFLMSSTFHNSSPMIPTFLFVLEFVKTLRVVRPWDP